MNESTYLTLLSMVSPLIQKKNPTMRQAVTAHERLTATSRFLATRRSYVDLKFSTIMSPQALGKIIPAMLRDVDSIKNVNELSFGLEDTTYTAVQRELRS